MAIITWTLHTKHGIMDILSHHIYKGIHYHTNQIEPLSGKFDSTVPPFDITFCHVSPNPMAVPIPFLHHLERRTQTTFGTKFIY